MDSATVEEIEITRLIFERLRKEKCLKESERETIAYRIAEIMSSMKQVYTQALPRLINAAGESTLSVDDELLGLQRKFTRLCDLMYEYDSAYLQALGHPDPTDGEKAAGLDGKPTQAP